MIKLQNHSQKKNIIFLRICCILQIPSKILLILTIKSLFEDHFWMRSLILGIIEILIWLCQDGSMDRQQIKEMYKKKGTIGFLIFLLSEQIYYKNWVNHDFYLNHIIRNHIQILIIQYTFIFNRETQLMVITHQVMMLLNTIRIQIIMQEEKQSNLKSSVFAFNMFLVLNLTIGQFLLLKNTYLIYFTIQAIIIFCIYLFINILRAKNLINQSKKYFSYQQEAIVDKIFGCLLYFLCLNLGLMSNFRKYHVNKSKQESQETWNVSSACQLIQVIILFVLNSKYSDEHLTHSLYSYLLQFYFILIIPFIFFVFKWLISFIIEGSDVKDIDIQSNNLEDLKFQLIKESKINSENKNKKKINNVLIRNYRPNSLEKVLNRIVIENNSFSIQVEFQNKKNRRSQKSIIDVLSLDIEKRQFLFQINKVAQFLNENICNIFAILCSSKFVNFQVIFLTLFNRSSEYIDLYFIQNYQILPNSVFDEIIILNIIQKSTLQYLQQLFRIITLKKYAESQFQMSPQQIYYDLYDQ